MNGITAKLLQILVNAKWMKLGISVQLHKLRGFHPKETELKLNIAWLVVFLLFAPKGKRIVQNSFPQKIQSLQEFYLATRKSYFSGKLSASSEAWLFRGEPM